MEGERAGISDTQGNGPGIYQVGECLFMSDSFWE